MIIYCTGSKRGDAAYKKLHKDIIDFTESLGHSVLSELSDKFRSTIPLTDNQIYKRSLKWIDGSKLMLSEVSESTLDVGFEIAYAVFERKIPALALYKADVQISSMLSGCDSPLLTIRKYYDADEMKSIIQTFINKIDNS
ncbi:MAG: hypothetical protein WBN42_05945 [Ignavibacteriaceae bacterium]